VADRLEGAEARVSQEATFVDLFAGCGGGSIGFLAAGLRPVAAVENDAVAAGSYQDNLRLAPFIEDIRDVTGDEILESAGLRPGELTLLFGCPPCQSFTILRRGSEPSAKDRERNRLPDEYLRLVCELLPRHMAFENVPGLATGRWKRMFVHLLEQLTKLGYAWKWALVDAADYGVPQRRRRLLLIGSRVTDPLLPDPTHGRVGLKPHVTVRKTIGHLPAALSPETLAGPGDDALHRARRHSALAVQRLRALREGQARADLPDHLQLDCHREHQGHYDIYGRMSWDRPAPTLTSGCTNVTRGRFAHPEQDRAITVREAMLLQAFPPWTTLRGGIEAMSLQVGNAIPPRLAELIGRTVLAMERVALEATAAA
jgi:DNA (cytosine-5)-methyltransferase 1